MRDFTPYKNELQFGRRSFLKTKYILQQVAGVISYIFIGAARILPLVQSASFYIAPNSLNVSWLVPLTLIKIEKYFYHQTWLVSLRNIHCRFNLTTY